MSGDLTGAAVLRTADRALEVLHREIRIGLRSRLVVQLLRLFFKPMLARMALQTLEQIARTQRRVSTMRCPDTAGMDLEYRDLGGISGHVLGRVDKSKPVVLWLHGGAFILPAAPTIHLAVAARLCRDLDASGFLPDYRLAPAHRFPAGLDDCERAYSVLLGKGIPASQIVLVGDSAGGNLMFGLLQRVRAAGLPMPVCAVAISPVASLGSIDRASERYAFMRRDPLLPVASMERIGALYAGDRDVSDPLLSPLHMDCTGLPPLLFMASANEFLLDQTVELARRAHEAGVPTTCHVWPTLPHGFPLFESWFPEVRSARQDMAAFIRQYLTGGSR